MTQEINTHFNDGILKDNREVHFSCSMKPIVNEKIIQDNKYIIIIQGRMKSNLLGVGVLKILHESKVVFESSANMGGFGAGAPPNGKYLVNNYRNRRPKKNYSAGMNAHGVGFSYDLLPQFSTKRSLLRIHPDGNNPGTLGCIGLAGNKESLLDFEEKMNKILTVQKIFLLV